MTSKGAIAAGHPETAAAAAAILDAGGNAFDAVLAALYAACIAEPVLASLGGGGFLMARPAGGAPLIYDFFAHTPKTRPAAADADFHPIVADFGTVQQEFHIGMGSMAVPGAVKGIFQVHQDLGTIPMARIVEPAIDLARRGVTINRLQAYIFQIVGKIYTANEAGRAIFGSSQDARRTIGEGETFFLHGFAETLESLAREGDDLFYLGELGRRIAADCRDGGGVITAEDLAAYDVVKRQPLARDYHGVRLFTNPPPSTGGILIAFALELLRDAEIGTHAFGGAGHLALLARVMELTNKARVDSKLHKTDGAAARLLHPEFVEAYRAQVLGRPAASRGTTHISIIDAQGNAASLSLTNGEGSAYIVPGTGIMLNNMLGEDDLNAAGFFAWPEGVRMSSMMTPGVIAAPDGAWTAFGSGGSNRIRSALTQVIMNVCIYGQSLDDAVRHPRMHLEADKLSLEPGLAVEASGWQNAIETWPAPNMFFGGAHVIARSAAGDVTGAGDPRRDGICLGL